MHVIIYISVESSALFCLALSKMGNTKYMCFSTVLYYQLCNVINGKITKILNRGSMNQWIQIYVTVFGGKFRLTFSFNNLKQQIYFRLSNVLDMVVIRITKIFRHRYIQNQHVQFHISSIIYVNYSFKLLCQLFIQIMQIIY